MADGLFGGAAFGFYPQLNRYRRGDPRDALNLPVDVTRGRFAGTMGTPTDIANLVRSPSPMEMFGDISYEPPAQLPYTTEHFLKELPMAPTSRLGQVAGQAASFAPMNPMPAVRGLQKVGGIVGEELAATLMGQRPGSMMSRVVPQPLFAVEPSLAQAIESIAPKPLAEVALQDLPGYKKLIFSEEFKKLKGNDKNLAIQAFEAKRNKTGVPRNTDSINALVGAGEEDITRSLMQSPAFKISGVIPKSVISEAGATRQAMRAEPAATPGAGASEGDWKAWGDMHGVNMTVTEPKSLAIKEDGPSIKDFTTGREILIPGGLEGKFSVPDMFWMKANNIDPTSLPKELHDKLMQKLIRTHEVTNPDQVDMFNRLNFALLSPNAPLTPNEFLGQRMRLTNMDELKALANRVDEPGLEKTAQLQTGVQAASRGGMGVLGTANLSNQANLAKLLIDKPEMFQMAPGETMRDVTIRVMNQVPGLGPKTASLGTPWLNLEKANTSAVDLHMIRNSYERMLDDPLVGDAFRTRMAGKLNVEPTTEAILGKPVKQVEDAAIDVIGGSSLARQYRMKTGELNEIPSIATPGRLAYEPKQFQDFNSFYKRVVDYVDESRGVNPSIELFPEQWRKWDVYRQRLEPHEFAHPDFRKLPRQSWSEMKDALTAHKESGYTQALSPIMEKSDWRKLYYGGSDISALAGTAGAAGLGTLGASLYQNSLPKQLAIPALPLATVDYSDPFQDSIR